MPKKILISLLALFLILCLIWRMTRISYMGDRSAIDFDAQSRENAKILFMAEREAFPYCKMEINDKGKLEIIAGNNRGTHLVSGKYTLSGDTLIFKESILGISDFIHTNKFLLKENKLLININEKGTYDTLSCLKIIKNKLRLR